MTSPDFVESLKLKRMHVFTFSRFFKLWITFKFRPTLKKSRLSGKPTFPVLQSGKKDFPGFEVQVQELLPLNDGKHLKMEGFEGKASIVDLRDLMFD